MTSSRNPQDGDHGRVFVSRDPRILVVAFLFVLAFTFVVDSTVGLSVLAGYVMAIYVLSGLPGRALWAALRRVAPFVLLVLVINTVLVEGSPLFGVPFLSTDGLIMGVFYSLRVVVLYLTLTLFLSVTSQESLAAGLSRLVRPLAPSLSRRIALHGFLSIAFLPLFADEVNRVRVAQTFRGGGMAGGVTQRIAGVRALLVPLFVSAIRRSGQLATAVELRGIERTIDRVMVMGRLGREDLVFALTTLAVLLFAVRL